MSEKPLCFCVMGAGHGGMAMAGHLALKGFKVRLFNRGESRLASVKEFKAIKVTGEEVEGIGDIEFTTTDPQKAISGADVLMVVVPATGHRYMAETMAPYLEDEQIILLNPGRTGGALEVYHILKEKGVKADVTVAEAQTFIYASRIMGPAEVKIFRVKNVIPLSAIPAWRTPQILKVLRKAYPQFTAGDNVLKTSLDNMGALFHPAVTILNAARIEATHGDFEYYTEGITPSVAVVLEAMDLERIAIANALGIRVLSGREWLYMAYDAAGRTLYEAIQKNPGYKGIKAPSTIYHRYILEDVPMSLVPMASLGDLLKVETPTIKAVIQLASVLLEIDFGQEGRTVEKLGLAGLSVRQIRRMSLEGNLGE